MANPPAPDVEAIARQIIRHSRSENDDITLPDCIVVDELALRGRIRSALTAHTASLQARVEELEEAAETAIAEIDSGAPYTAADVLRAALRPADEPVTQREMSDE